MFGSNILEVAISLVFIYLLLSLICSAVNEIIMRITAMRPRLLWKATSALLSDAQLAKDFFAHPLIKGLQTKELPPYIRWIPWSDFRGLSSEALEHKPAYIPSRTFALVIQDIARSTTDAGTASAESALAAKKLIAAFGPDVAAVQQNLENWFDDVMEHVTGWFKRKTQTTLLILGLIVAVWLNADSLMLAHFLWFNDAVRGEVVKAAERKVKQADEKKDSNMNVAEVKKLQAELQELALPFGWSFQKAPTDGSLINVRDFPPHFLGWMLKIFGLLVTAIALSLGADFWFNALKGLGTLRTTGKPPPKAEERLARKT